MVCAPEYLNGRIIREPKDVLGETLLVSDGKNQAGVWERWMQVEGLEPRRTVKRIKFDHVFVLIEAVTKGLGMAMLPYSLVASFLESGTLVEPLPGLEMPYPNLYALYPEAGRQPSSLKAFVSWLIEQGEDFSTRLERVRPIPASQQSVSPLVL